MGSGQHREVAVGQGVGSNTPSHLHSLSGSYVGGAAFKAGRRGPAQQWRICSWLDAGVRVTKVE